MANFSDDMKFMHAVAVVLKDEGGDKITDDPDDPGGRTKYGISARFLKSIGLSAMVVDDLTEDQARNLYYSYFWLEYHFDALAQFAEAVSAKAFNFCVTAGPDPAFRCLQRAMRACGQDVKEDGVMGPITRGLLLKMSSGPEADYYKFGLMCAYKSEIAGYYRDLDKPKYEAGWVNRAYRG